MPKRLKVHLKTLNSLIVPSKGGVGKISGKAVSVREESFETIFHLFSFIIYNAV